MKNKDKRISRVSGVMKKRLYLVLFVILVLCGILIGRLVYLNNVDGDRYAKAVLSQQSYSSRTIASERGNILDRNGIVLARSEKVYNVIIDPKVILSQTYYYEPTMEAIKTVFGYDENEIADLINRNSSSSYIKYEENISYSKVSEFNKYKSGHKFVVGVWFEEEYKRVYPYSTLASHVIGFTTDGVSGTYGLEQYYNEELTGVEGMEYGYFDSELNSKKTVKEAKDGNDIVSTIDYNIQTVVEKKISDFRAETGSNNIGVIVMNPNNGEIYAMASNAEYDLNNPRSLEAFYSEEELSVLSADEKLNALYDIWRNYCISDTYEPGSTYKTITVASALEEHATARSNTYECLGSMEVGGWKIGCNNKYGHGNIDLAQSLMKSCNCALMQIAEALGRDSFYSYQSKFGFGQKTGIDIVGEASGIVIPKKSLNATELATSSFGTTFNVSMIQMAAAYASIINGGSYYQPHLVREITDSDGVVLKSFDDMLIRETVSNETSSFIRDALYMTVEEGTATPAKVSGYLIGGKTGTAQKRPREDKKYVVSFAGFAPVSAPEVLIYIVIDEIHDEKIAGSSSSATKMSASIMKEILPYLGLYPEGEIEYNVNFDLLEDNSSFYRPEEDEGNPDVLPDELSTGQ